MTETKKRMGTVRLRKKRMIRLLIQMVLSQLKTVKLRKKAAVREVNHASDPVHRVSAPGHVTVGPDQGNVAQGPGLENAVQDLGRRAGPETDVGTLSHGLDPDLRTAEAARRVRRARGPRIGM